MRIRARGAPSDAKSREWGKEEKEERVVRGKRGGRTEQTYRHTRTHTPDTICYTPHTHYIKSSTPFRKLSPHLPPPRTVINASLPPVSIQRLQCTMTAALILLFSHSLILSSRGTHATHAPSRTSAVCGWWRQRAQCVCGTFVNSPVWSHGRRCRRRGGGGHTPV